MEFNCLYVDIICDDELMMSLTDTYRTTT